MTIVIVAAVVVFFGILALLGLQGLIFICAPNEVLIFAGRRRREGDRIYGYRLIKGGRGIRVPFLERVDRMDLTNIVIDIAASNAYSKGGIPLTVHGVANVKIAGHEPLLNNAIERFLGKSRAEITAVAKSTLEGSLRGILATMTPEQVNEDKLMFAERLVQEVEQDMNQLGLVVDTLKVQNVQDEVRYLDSLGRKRNAEIIAKARIAEATAQSQSSVRSAENFEREQRAIIEAQVSMSKADAQRRLTDAQTRRAALVAEEQAQVIAAVAKAKAEVSVQNARVEQVRRKLEADVIQPARASAEAAEAQAKAQTAGIIEDGRARAEALRKLADTYRSAGPAAREILLAQKLDGVIQAITNTIPATTVEKMTMIDSRIKAGGFNPASLLSANEQIKQVFGIDLVDKVSQMGAKPAPPAPIPAPTVPAPTQTEPVPPLANDSGMPPRLRKPAPPSQKQ